MRLWIYKNNLCDPARNVGFAKQFHTARDVDEWLYMFIKVLPLKTMLLKTYRAFVTNDEVTFEEVDHFVLMDEPYGLSINADKIKELDLQAMWKEVNGVSNA